MRLRARLSKLGAVKLLRGTKLSGELGRLQDQLERLREEPSAEEIWRSVERARHADRPYTLDYVERILEDFFELHGDRGRARQARRPDDRHRRTPEGPRPEGKDFPELRHGVSRGLPEGNARDGTRRPAPVPAHHPRGHARRLSRRRGRTAWPGRRDRTFAGRDGAALGSDCLLHHR